MDRQPLDSTGTTSTDVTPVTTPLAQKARLHVLATPYDDGEHESFSPKNLTKEFAEAQKGVDVAESSEGTWSISGDDLEYSRQGEPSSVDGSPALLARRTPQQRSPAKRGKASARRSGSIGFLTPPRPTVHVPSSPPSSTETPRLKYPDSLDAAIEQVKKELRLTHSQVEHTSAQYTHKLLNALLKDLLKLQMRLDDYIQTKSRNNRKKAEKEVENIAFEVHEIINNIFCKNVDEARARQIHESEKKLNKLITPHLHKRIGKIVGGILIFSAILLLSALAWTMLASGVGLLGMPLVFAAAIHGLGLFFTSATYVLSGVETALLVGIATGFAEGVFIPVAMSECKSSFFPSKNDMVKKTLVSAEKCRRDVDMYSKSKYESPPRARAASLTEENHALSEDASVSLLQ